MQALASSFNWASVRIEILRDFLKTGILPYDTSEVSDSNVYVWYV